MTAADEDFAALLARLRGRTVAPWMVETVAKRIFYSGGFAGRPVAWESEDEIVKGVRWGEAGRERLRARALEMLEENR